MKFLTALFCFIPFWIMGQTLSDQDVLTYQNIFKAQKVEDWTSADKYIKQLKNKTLMCDVLYDRYLSKTYRTKGEEIQNWLKDCPQHPNADVIYQLGKQKKVKLTAKKPKSLFGTGSGSCTFIYREEPIDLLYGREFKYLSVPRRQKAKSIMEKIIKYLKSGQTLWVRQLVDGKDAKNLFNIPDHDAAKIALAFSYFLDGMDDKAIEYALPATKRSGNLYPLGNWVLGLAYWRKGDFKTASHHFHQVSVHPKSYPLLRSAGAFWESRTLLKMGRFEDVNQALTLAAQSNQTFYGLLAQQMLGNDLEHSWEILPPSEGEISCESPLWEKALNLKKIGKKYEAQKTISYLYLLSNEATRSDLIRLSMEHELDADLNLIIGQIKDGKERFPMPSFQPIDGWKVDPALIFAFIKQESCFNERAKSSVGAIGLMQLMPSTAKQFAPKAGLEWDSSKLIQSEYNISLGQEYILWLLNDFRIENNLFLLAMAYNGGAGATNTWKKRMKYQNDPLLFIESIPSKETRGFVERVMANYWIYQTLMGKEVTTIKQIIMGQFPTYTNPS